MNPDTMEDLGDGEQGLLLARGPGVMAGYYHDQENTHKAFAPGSGWFDTGDLGWRAPGQHPSSNPKHISLGPRCPNTFGCCCPRSVAGLQSHRTGSKCDAHS